MHSATITSYQIPFNHVQEQCIKSLARVWACTLGGCKLLRIAQMSRSRPCNALWSKRHTLDTQEVPAVHTWEYLTLWWLPWVSYPFIGYTGPILYYYSTRNSSQRSLDTLPTINTNWYHLSYFKALTVF